MLRGKMLYMFYKERPVFTFGKKRQREKKGKTREESSKRVYTKRRTNFKGRPVSGRGGCLKKRVVSAGKDREPEKKKRSQIFIKISPEGGKTR